ncbi:MAG: hypothetical protein CVU06_15565, partial [Bacteroidetes bacterium HGW-Bacteroidetes-22]
LYLPARKSNNLNSPIMYLQQFFQSCGKALLPLAISFLFPFGLYAQTSLPFSETWESGQFTTHGWAVNQGSGQCLIVDEGISGGKAVKLGHLSSQAGTDPVILDSPPIDATNWQPGILYFSFNYSLINPDTTKWPLLRILYNTGEGWVQLFELGNDTSYGYREFKTDLLEAHGKVFSLRFEAIRQADSVNGRWLIDNINLHGQGGILFNLNGQADTKKNNNEYGIHLSWNQPVFDTVKCTDTTTVSYYLPELPPHWGAYGFIGVGSGILIKNSFPANSVLYQVNFKHRKYQLDGRFPFNIHIIDWVNKTFIKSLGPFLTKASSGWEADIPLNLTSFQSVDTIGVFLEPLLLDPSQTGLPCLSGDGQYIPSNLDHPFMVFLNDLTDYYDIYGYMGSAHIGVTFLTPDGKVISADDQSALTDYNIQRWQQSLPLNYN